MHFKTFLDGGAYGSYGVASTFYTGALQTVTYEVPRYKFEGARVFTNKPPCGPKRGHGTPQPRYGLEVHLDKIAEQLNLDPAEMRRNHLGQAEFSHRELSAHRQHGSGRVHRQSCRRIGLEEEVFVESVRRRHAC